MARVGVNFKLQQGGLRKLGNILRRAVGRTIRDRFVEVTPLVAQIIDEVVEDNRSLFIPNDQQAAELGIGEGGQIDPRRSTAWEVLRPDSSSVTSYFVRRIGGRSSLVGQINISINEEEFYNAPDSIIETPDSDLIDEIPWMRWFIEGKTIAGVRFSRRAPEVSRTGRGIMIDGGFWTFPPTLPQGFDFLLNEILERLSSEFRGRRLARILER